MESYQNHTTKIKDVLTAQFREYSNGDQYLEIMVGTMSESIRWENRNCERYHPWFSDVIKLAESVGFQADTYLIDNRNEDQIKKDWSRYQVYCSQVGLASPTLQEYIDRIKMAF